MTGVGQRRVVLDRSFESAIEAVLEALLCEGFTVDPVEAGDLHREARPGEPLRYALLEATPSDARDIGPEAGEAPKQFACRISVFELARRCTLVTAEPPRTHSPFFGRWMPRLVERLAAALDAVSRRRRKTAPTSDTIRHASNLAAPGAARIP
jgi:hypothetical protein